MPPDAARWRRWRDDARAATESAKRLAYLLAGLVVLLCVVLGLQAFGIDQRYPVVVYSFVLGLLAWLAVMRIVVSQGFGSIARSVHELLVPHVVQAINNQQLLQLVRFGSVMVAMGMLRVVDDGDYIRILGQDPREEPGMWGQSGGGWVGDSDGFDPGGGGDFGGGGGDGG